MITYATDTYPEENSNHSYEIDEYIVSNNYIGMRIASFMIHQVIFISDTGVIFKVYNIGTNHLPDVDQKLFVHLKQLIDEKRNIHDIVNYMEFMAL